MAITAITIENFKGIKGPLRIELKPVTLLFGPNSAGKSSIIQVLHYASEIFNQHNLDPHKTVTGGDSVDLGGFKNFVHNHDTTLPIKLRFDFEVIKADGNWTISYPALNKNLNELDHDRFVDIFWEKLDKEGLQWVEITINFNSEYSEPVISSYRTGYGKKLFAEIITSTDKHNKKTLRYLDLNNPVFITDTNENLAIKYLSHSIKNQKKNIVDLKLSYPSHLPEISSYMLFGNSDECNSDTIDNFSHFKTMDSFMELIKSMLSVPVEYLNEYLERFRYVGPMRITPDRGYAVQASTKSSYWPDGSAAWSELLHRKYRTTGDALRKRGWRLQYEFKESFGFEPNHWDILKELKPEDLKELLKREHIKFIEKINYWMSKKLRTGYNFELNYSKVFYKDIDEKIFKVLKNDSLQNKENFLSLLVEIQNLPQKPNLKIYQGDGLITVEPCDIGTGISQILPVIALSLAFNEGILAIEQPELHIHPALQVELADLFIEQMLYPDQAGDGRFFLLETHSEHLLLRLLRRIRETSEQKPPENCRIKKEELAIYFIEQSERGTTCMPIDVDDDGDFIDHWPRGFFTERAKELF